MEEAKNIEVLLHANAVEIETNDEGDLVTGVRVRTRAGNEFRVEAPTVVLATGGIENARPATQAACEGRIKDMPFDPNDVIRNMPAPGSAAEAALHARQKRKGKA